MPLNPFRWAVEQVRKRLQAGLATRADLDRLYERVAAAVQIQGALNGLPVVRPMPGWALSSDAIVQILCDLQERPNPVLVEFGSGQSTVIFAAWFRARGCGRFVSFEHDPAHAEAIGRQLEAAKLVAQVELNVIPLADRAAVDGLAASKSYALPDTFPGVDVALVDGPSYFFGESTRYHPLTWSIERLNPGGAAYLDDTIRPQEKRILEVLARRRDLKVQDLGTANGFARISRKARA
ncbi:MAG TPA: class I SAM-dependent methyltransferase [Vicinamibacterales bacterium]|nr:class I SAM-dependent methyltransferase [Vicinamibacterales bacterium]